MSDLSRPVYAGIVVAWVCSIGVILSNRLPAPAANSQARRCEIPAETPRPLDLGRFTDRAHLRAEAATAESWALAFADVSPARRQGSGAYAEVGDRCMAALFATVSQRHAIDGSTVREYAQQRNVMFDAAVLVAFALAYAVVAHRVIGVVRHRFPTGEHVALVAALIIVSGMTVVLATLAGDVWSISAEILRVGNGHLSYRTERLPWRQHRSMILAATLGLFWIVAAVRIKAGSARSLTGP